MGEVAQRQEIRVALEEVVLESQRQVDAIDLKVAVQSELVTGNVNNLNYVKGMQTQAHNMYNYISAVYESAIAKLHIADMEEVNGGEDK